MPGFKISRRNIGDGVPDGKTRIEYESDNTTETFWQSHMFKDVILELIYSADFSKWDEEDNELSSHEFTKLVISALTERWYYQNPAAGYTSNVKEQLLEMIDYFELDKVTLSLDDDEE